jgi:hypothetical protein
MRRPGFLWVSAQAAILLTFLLLGSAAVTVLSVLHQADAMERARDRLFLARETMEIIKYNRRFGERVSHPEGMVQRNGRSYEVRIDRRARLVNDMSMEEIVVEVFDDKRNSTKASAWIGRL